MNHLEPCPHCRRHVKLDETACPFCAQPLAFAPRAPRVVPRAPISRAALFAFGVGVSALAAPGCGGDDAPTPDAPAAADAAIDATVDADLSDADPNAPDGGGVPIYAAAPTTPPTEPSDPSEAASG